MAKMFGGILRFHDSAADHAIENPKDTVNADVFRDGVFAECAIAGEQRCLTSYRELEH